MNAEAPRHRGVTREELALRLRDLDEAAAAEIDARGSHEAVRGFADAAAATRRQIDDMARGRRQTEAAREAERERSPELAIRNAEVERMIRGGALSDRQIVARMRAKAKEPGQEWMGIGSAGVAAIRRKVDASAARIVESIAKPRR